MSIQWLPPQKEVLKRFDRCGMMYVETRRQFGKTTLFAGVAMRQMMRHPGRLVTFASASLNVGKELIYKQDSVVAGALRDMRDQGPRGQIKADATALFTAVGKFKEDAAAANTSFSLADAHTGKSYQQIDIDGIADLFERSRLEMRLKHSASVVSRTQIIAPNPATARGFSGDVLIDEIGFIADFQEVWEAMEPIASRDPTFRVLMASTPPKDESHLCYKIGEPPDGMKFEPNGEGHWYRSKAGVMTLRVDVWDAEQCGVYLYGLEKRERITPEQHRDTYLDKDGWDRNYALKRIPGGLVAMPATVIDRAQARGKEHCVFLDIGTIDGNTEAEQTALDKVQAAVASVAVSGTWGMGYDVATTTGKKSNPSALTLCQARGGLRDLRLIVRWKTSNPDFSERLLQVSIDALTAGNAKPRCLCIDASSERFFARRLKDNLKGCRVDLVVSNEVTQVGLDPPMRQKEIDGNRLVNAGHDNTLSMPPGNAVKNDWLLVKKEKGFFEADVDSAGNHADTFDSSKLSLRAVDSGGSVMALFPSTSSNQPRQRRAAPGERPQHLNPAPRHV